MFGLGMMEILMILAIALIVVGPKKLPELAKTLGRAMGEFKRSAQDLKQSLDVESAVKDITLPKTDLNKILNDSDDADDSSSSSSDAQTQDADFTSEKTDSPRDKSDPDTAA